MNQAHPRVLTAALHTAFLTSLHYNIFIELDSTLDCEEELSYLLRRTDFGHSRESSIYSMSSITSADVAPPQAFRIANPQSSEQEADLATQETFLGEDGLPILDTFVAEDEKSRTEALRIVADSVAQQRNTGSKALILHPAAVLILAVIFAFLKQIYTEDGETKWLMIGTTSLGVIMSLLGAVRLMLGPYIFEAERVGTWTWLKEGRSTEDEEESGYRVLGDRDEIMVTRYGEEIIGAIIFRGVQIINPPASPPSSKRARRAQSPSKSTKMVIRAWSVRQKYRRKEVGAALLEDAIKFGSNKGWTADGVIFAEDHANSKRVLPSMFNSALDKYVKIAHKTLEKKIEELGLVEEKPRKKK